MEKSSSFYGGNINSFYGNNGFYGNINYLSKIKKLGPSSIVSFNDAIKNSKIKQLKVDIQPVQEGSGDPSPVNIRSIRGWTGANVVISPTLNEEDGTTYSVTFPTLGKNLADMQEENIKLGYYIATNGAETANAFNFIYTPYIPVKANTAYTISISSSVYFISISEYSSANNAGFIIRKAGNTGSNTKFTITTGDSTKYIRFGSNMRGSSGSNLTMQEILSVDWMLEEGSTTSTYEPYTSTVYGGSLDVVTGVLTVDRASFVLDGSIPFTLQNGVFVQDKTGIRRRDASDRKDQIVISDRFKSGGLGYRGECGDGEIIKVRGANTQIACYSSAFASVAEFNASLVENPMTIVYELATPITYQLTPTEVTTLLGTNNIWADAGDVEVTYQAKA